MDVQNRLARELAAAVQQLPEGHRDTAELLIADLLAPPRPRPDSEAVERAAVQRRALEAFDAPTPAAVIERLATLR